MSNALQTNGKTGRFDFLLAAALVIITVAAFSQVFTNGFVNFDDPFYVTNNENVLAGLTSASIAWAFHGPHGANWHPITSLSHLADVQFFGLNPGAHHAENLAFHVINTLLLFYWLRRYAGTAWPSFIVAALFALHPQHVEPVAWISSRKDVLSTFFWLLAMFAYCKYAVQPNIRRYLLVCLWLALGLMSKPMVVTAPITLLLLDIWPLKRISFEPSQDARKRYAIVRQLFNEKIPFLGLSILQSLATLWAQSAGGAVVTAGHVTLPVRISNAAYAYGLYLMKMLWPVDLVPFYPYRGLSAIGGVVLLVILALVCVTIAAVMAVRKYPYVTFGWFWFVITLLPVIGIVQVGNQGMADRYTYVPYIGLFIGIVWLVSDISSRTGGAQRVLGAAAVLVLAALAVLTYRQTGHWKDTLSLWRHAVNVEPFTIETMKELAAESRRANKIDEAIAILQYADQLRPNAAGVNNNIGLALLQKNDVENAIVFFEKELKSFPDDVMANTNMGNALFRQKKPQDAERYFARAVEINPSFEDAHNGLGMAAMVQGRAPEAIKHFKRCLELAPRKVEAITNLAAAYMQLGDSAQALKWCRDALAVNPNYRQAQEIYKRLTAAQPSK
jgi:Flp pilus assembly protein TadD